MSTPEQAGFRMPAEWHPHERCWMAWPCREETWEAVGLLRARTAYAEVAKAIARHEPVSMLVNPEDMTEAARLCGSQINLEPLALDDSWTRDTGPSFLLGANQELAGVDWIHNAWGGTYENCERDNQIAANILQKTKARAFKAPLVMEGGSFHVDGQGTILTTRECLLHPNRNPQLKAEEIESYLCQYLGGKKVIWLNEGLIGDETNGHVDEIACFIGPGKVLCLITSDKDDENYDRLQENREILATATDAKGQRLTVHTVEQPKATYLNQERLTLSYINYYLANQGIVMASFGDKARDQAAYALFRGLFPAQVVTQLPALDIFAGGGGIHCITQQQPRST